MPPLPSQWLSEFGVAEFAESAVSNIEQYARGWAFVRSEQSEAEDSFRSFIELGAAEFALAPLYRGELTVQGGPWVLAGLPPAELGLPVHVDDRAAADAIYKTDCGPFMEHLRKDSSQLKPWDVFTFAGDMSKFELLSLTSDVNALADPKVMDGAVSAMAERYINAGLGVRVVESGLLAAQELVWSTKLAVLRGTDYTHPRDLNFASRFLGGQALA
jgi:hypothetical protein